MNDYQEKLQEEQTEQKPKRKKKTIQERLDRALELKAKTEKQLAAIQKRLDGYNKQVEELQVEARLEVIKQALKVPPQSVSEPEESNPVNIDEEEQVSPISDTKTNFPTSNNVVPSSSYTGSKLNIVSFGKIVAWLVVLFLALYGAGVSHTIAVGLKTGAIKTTQSTPKQTSTVSDMSDEHEVDVFSRYFIGAYLTNSDLDNFISSKVSNKPFDKVTTTAVLLEKAQTKDKQTYEMTYVVSYNKDDKTKSSRFKFTVKKAKKAMYGYEVTKLPKESDYPG